MLGTSLLLWNCEKNENVLEATNLESKHTFIKPELAIEEIRSVYNSNKYKGQKPSNEHKKILSEINTKVVAKKSIAAGTRKIYSFVLKKSLQNKTASSNVYFDNLFVNIDKEKNIEYHLMRYIPTSEWLANNGNLAEYSGKIQYLSDVRKVISSITLEKGIEIKVEQKRQIQAKCGFKLVYKMTVCGALDGDAMSCTHFYELENDCDGSGGSTTGGEDFSSGSDFSESDGSTTDWGSNNDDETTGGDTSSGSGGSSFGGEPILDRCPEGTLIDPKTGYCIVKEVVEDDIIDETNNPCVSTIIKALQEKDMKGALVPDLEGMGHLSQMVLDLFGECSNYDLVIDVAQLDAIGTNVNAETDGIESITLDTDLVKDATQLSIAKTLIHESLHAFINLNLDKYNRNKTFIQAIEVYYTKYNDDSNLSQHSFMSQFVEALACSLSAYDNHQQPMEYYTTMSWGGLESSDTYKALSSSEKTTIQKIINNERYAKSDAKSTKCP